MNISALTLFRTRTGWRPRLSDGVRARGVIRVMVAWLGKRAEHLDQRPSGVFAFPMGAGEEGPAQVEARQVPQRLERWPVGPMQVVQDNMTGTGGPARSALMRPRRAGEFREPSGTTSPPPEPADELVGAAGNSPRLRHFTPSSSTTPASTLSNRSPTCSASPVHRLRTPRQDINRQTAHHWQSTATPR